VRRVEWEGVGRSWKCRKGGGENRRVPSCARGRSGFLPPSLLLHRPYSKPTTLHDIPAPFSIIPPSRKVIKADAPSVVEQSLLSSTLGGLGLLGLLNLVHPTHQHRREVPREARRVREEFPIHGGSLRAAIHSRRGGREEGREGR